MKDGFLKVGVASVDVEVANPIHNKEKVMEVIIYSALILQKASVKRPDSEFYVLVEFLWRILTNIR